MKPRDGNDAENRPTERDARQPATQLECIGSFNAHTQDGEVYTIDIFTQFGAVHDRGRLRVEPSLLHLTTKDGYGVDRVAQGEYRLRDNPEISFSTDDPNAP